MMKNRKRYLYLNYEETAMCCAACSDSRIYYRNRDDILTASMN